MLSAAVFTQYLDASLQRLIASSSAYVTCPACQMSAELLPSASSASSSAASNGNGTDANAIAEKSPTDPSSAGGLNDDRANPDANANANSSGNGNGNVNGNAADIDAPDFSRELGIDDRPIVDGVAQHHFLHHRVRCRNAACSESFCRSCNV